MRRYIGNTATAMTKADRNGGTRAEGLFMAADFRRKNIRLASENYIGRRLYFLTL